MCMSGRKREGKDSTLKYLIEKGVDVHARVGRDKDRTELWNT